jgi:outer membrane protein assembly factor BamE (lipoprotein component of BamABCDE complex)
MQQYKAIRNVIIGAMILLAGCATPPPPAPPPSPLTQGNVQLSLEKGKTTQNEVLRAFGTPNISSINSDGQTVWTYQQIAVSSSSQASADLFTVILASNASSGASRQRTQRAMTLIITFDHGVVSDYRSLATQF